MHIQDKNKWLSDLEVGSGVRESEFRHQFHHLYSMGALEQSSFAFWFQISYFIKRVTGDRGIIQDIDIDIT